MLKKNIFILAVLFLLGLSGSVLAQKRSTAMSAWDLGSNLGFAAVKYSRDEDQKAIDFLNDEAKNAARELRIVLPPLPAKTGNLKENRKRIMNYLFDSIENQVIKSLSEDYDSAHASLFDTALKLNIALLLYPDKEDKVVKDIYGTTVGSVELQTRLANLSEKLTAEFTKIAKSNSEYDILLSEYLLTYGAVKEHLAVRDYYEKGNSYAAKKDYTEAIAQYTKVIQMDENFEMAYFKRALAYYDLAKDDLAFADFTKFIALAATNKDVKENLAEAYANRCVLYSEKRDFVKAAADCNKSIEIQPNSSFPYLYRGDLNLDQGKTLHAVLDYTKSIEIEPSYWAYHNRGVASLRLGDYEGAVEDLTQAIKLSPTSAKAFYNRGVVYQRMGQDDLARRDFETAEMLEPGIVNKYTAKR